MRYATVKLVSCASNKGFVYTLDALLSLGVALSMLSSLAIIQREDAMHGIALRGLAQDIMEVCSIREDFSYACFSEIRMASPSLRYSLYENGIKAHGDAGEKDYVSVKRRYPLQSLELRLWAE